MFFNEDPEHEARWEARERERLARWYQDRVKVDQAEQKPLPTAAAQPAQPAQHPDDEAVDRFAEAMKQKLAQAREKGRGGWETCPPEELSRMLREHVEKGDPRDVANFCMFLWSLGHGITAPQPAQQPLTETEVMAAFDDEAEDDDAAPFVFLAGVRFAERKHGIGVKP